MTSVPTHRSGLMTQCSPPFEWVLHVPMAACLLLTGEAGFSFRGGGGSIEPSGRTPPQKGLN